MSTFWEFSSDFNTTASNRSKIQVKISALESFQKIFRFWIQQSFGLSC